MTIVMNKLLEYLEYLFPNPKCELIYQNDYQLLMAIVLSAQSTDKRVNSVTPIIFSKYKTLEELKLADLSDLEQIIRPVGSFRKKAAFLKGLATISKKFDIPVFATKEAFDAMPAQTESDTSP